MSKTENTKVMPLGEDGDLWLVTGTTDAHSAWQAAHDYDIAESTGYEVLEGMDPDLATITYRTDWAWVPVDPNYPDDEEYLKRGDEGGDRPRFAGFLVRA